MNRKERVMILIVVIVHFALLLALAASCGPTPEPSYLRPEITPVPQIRGLPENVSRFIDREYDNLCYTYERSLGIYGYGVGISCVPLKDQASP